MSERKKRVVSNVGWPTTIEINISGGLVTLKTFTIGDAPEIFALIDRNREHLTRFEENKETSVKYPDLKSVETSITTPKNVNRRRFTIRNQQGILVGSINITPDKENPKSAEIGYYLGAEFTGKNYMGTALNLLTQYAFTNLKCDIVYGKVVVENDASAKVLQKCGFIETSGSEREIIYTRHK